MFRQRLCEDMAAAIPGPLLDMQHPCLIQLLAYHIVSTMFRFPCGTVHATKDRQIIDDAQITDELIIVVDLVCAMMRRYIDLQTL